MRPPILNFCPSLTKIVMLLRTDGNLLVEAVHEFLYVQSTNKDSDAHESNTLRPADQYNHRSNERAVSGILFDNLVEYKGQTIAVFIFRNIESIISIH
jgi:hypothetical protein